MYDIMKKQNFGVEIELTGITREKGARIISAYFGGTAVHHASDGYDTWTAGDRKGRTWKCSRDVSIAQKAEALPDSLYERLKDLSAVIICPE